MRGKVEHGERVRPGSPLVTVLSWTPIGGELEPPASHRSSSQGCLPRHRHTSLEPRKGKLQAFVSDD